MAFCYKQLIHLRAMLGELEQKNLLPAQAKVSDDFGTIETATNILAKQSKIEVPPFQSIQIGERSAFLVKRFDRVMGKRVAYQSADTLLEKGYSETLSYVDFVEQLASVSAKPDQDCAELFRRIAFNLLVRNIDDHLRNHGIILTPLGWRLTPVFDINADAVHKVLSTPIINGGEQENRTFFELFEARDYFRLTAQQAIDIAKQVEKSTRNWADILRQQGIEPEALPYYAAAFENPNRNLIKDL